MKNAYGEAGVDVEAGYEVVNRIRPHIARTSRPGVMGGFGGFGGCFDLGALDYKHPILVSGTDGVGTKLMVAIAAKRYDTVGIDCVAMCVNDVAAQGAQPLYFLDYIATGKNEPAVMADIVAGVAEGCVQAGAALIGGETAEMPGMYGPGDFDLAGFAVGAAEKANLVTGTDIAAGDVLLGLPSSGFHSNGFSLIRKVLFDDAGLSVDSPFPLMDGGEGEGEPTISDVLLSPTKIYVKALMPLVEAGLVKGAAHVTGGGFVENLPRMLPDGLAAQVNLGSWPVPQEFTGLQRFGNIPANEMYEIFNMGIGMCLAISPENLDEAQRILADLGEESFVVGTVQAGSGVDFVGQFEQ